MSAKIELPHHESQGHSLKRKRVSLQSSGNKKHRLVKTEMEDIEETSEEIAKQYKKYTNAPKYDLNSEELYCVCRKPDEGELMIACDGCEEWFHAKCMNIKPELSNMIAKFYCKFCVWKGEGVTLWKRKCRLDECCAPIMDQSKYCSPEHGKEYMRRLLLENSVLDQGVIKRVLTHVNKDVEKLHALGSKFPELEEVTSFRLDGKMDQFPQDVREQIETLRGKIEDVKEKKQVQKQEQERLQKVKENVKLINEKLSSLIFPAVEEESKPRSKKNKQKKRVDLCLCNKGEHSLIQEVTTSDKLLEQIAAKIKKRMNEDEEQDEEEQEEDADPDWFQSCICVRDKKKCYRHNGWWNLFYDDTEKLLDQLGSKELTLEKNINEILRHYSIEKYNGT